MNKIIVCNKCWRASCWRGIFMCDEANKYSGTKEMTIKKLKKLKLEHSDYWKK